MSNICVDFIIQIYSWIISIGVPSWQLLGGVSPVNDILFIHNIQILDLIVIDLSLVLPKPMGW